MCLGGWKDRDHDKGVALLALPRGHRPRRPRHPPVLLGVTTSPRVGMVARSDSRRRKMRIPAKPQWHVRVPETGTEMPSDPPEPCSQSLRFKQREDTSAAAPPPRKKGSRITVGSIRVTQPRPLVKCTQAAGNPRQLLNLGFKSSRPPGVRQRQRGWWGFHAGLGADPLVRSTLPACSPLHLSPPGDRLLPSSPGSSPAKLVLSHPHSRSLSCSWTSPLGLQMLSALCLRGLFLDLGSWGSAACLSGPVLTAVSLWPCPASVHLSSRLFVFSDLRLWWDPA